MRRVTPYARYGRSALDEDLAGASYAGLYESVLNVDTTDVSAVQAAVRRCFGAAFDIRVARYKREMGQSSGPPAIALIVQRQVPSEVAGVVFSHNPLTNDADEMLVNAHRGLGEQLVAGEVTPDAFVVDRIRRAIAERRAEGSGACLADTAVVQLVDTVAGIEEQLGYPVDVEFANAAGKTWVVQARPITSLFALPEALRTPRGAPRMLYVDRGLQDGLTISEPISPMTSSVFERVFRPVLSGFMKIPADRAFEAMGLYFCGARIYQNFSFYLHLFGRGDRFMDLIDDLNTLLGDVLRSRRYRSLSNGEAAAGASPGALC